MRHASHVTCLTRRLIDLKFGFGCKRQVKIGLFAISTARHDLPLELVEGLAVPFEDYLNKSLLEADCGWFFGFAISCGVITLFVLGFRCFLFRGWSFGVEVWVFDYLDLLFNLI